MISRDDADRALTGLGAAHDRIAAAMYAVDVHPGLEALRAGGLTGQTESRWQVLRPEVDLLWAYFAALGDALERARQLRGRPRMDDDAWNELTRLLGEPVVPLGPDGMPVEATVPAVSRLSIGELAQRLEQRSATVLAHLSEVDAARTAVTSAVARAAEAVEAAATLAVQLGETGLAEELRTALAEVPRDDLADPLSAAPAGRLSGAVQTRLDRLRDKAGEARRSLDEVATLRNGYPDRRASLASALDEVAAAEEAVARAHRRVTEKIADPGLGDVPAAIGVLRARLTELDQLAHDGQWRKLADQMSIVESSARRARDRARELAELAEGLLGRRDELRGRLEAYRAKVAARGLAEDEDLSVRYTEAHALLFTAPCDLRAATRAVYAYQQALADVLDRAERTDADD